MSVKDSAPRRWLVPEVVQTSAMDCGPATLTCLLAGFRIPVSYGRLREACQTDVDGTSIDTMEEVAGQLGLDAEQTMLPLDHLLIAEARALPALVVVRLPNGLTHFVVAWRRHGSFVQVMDPATGRRWLHRREFLDEVHVHEFPLTAAEWRRWAGTEEHLGALRRRQADLGLGADLSERLVTTALGDPGWRRLAALDAATRMVNALGRSGGLRRGPEAGRVLETLLERAQEKPVNGCAVIPKAYWSVQPAPAAPSGEEQIVLRGAVLVRVLGRKDRLAPEPPPEPTPEPLSPELLAALHEPPSRPGRELARLLTADGLLAPTALIVALASAAAGVVAEALRFRGLFDLGRELTVTGQRLTAMSLLLLFLLGMLFLEWPLAAAMLRFGRRLEARLRLAFLEKIPRLVDRYFQSRLTSDMAERSHSVHTLRLLPELGLQFLRAAFELALTAAGIIWLDPPSAPLALLAAGVALGVPLLCTPLLVERDLRVRTHLGALTRFYLDALLGLVPARAHSAERALRREHESLVMEWARAGLGLQRTAVAVEAVQSLVGFGLAAWLLFSHLGRGGLSGGVLLLVYWALNLPVLGQEIALLVRQYPEHRNLTLRLFAPLGAAEEPARAAEGPSELTVPNENVPRATARSSSDACGPEAVIRGVAIRLEEVTVRAAGHTILENINLAIEPGSHVAIVGPSGAGKSSLVGLLLGWHRPASGRVRVDDEPMGVRQLDRLRRHTAWVDPAVQLWNRSLLENLGYGADGEWAQSIGRVIEQAELVRLLEALPDGLQTPLGESGGLVSGGEGQRIRLGRAMLRPEVRLAILDEPFRGLNRELRRKLLARVQKLWRETTLLCITHDVGETRAFPQVLVVEGGHIVEDGAPGELATHAGSRYRALLEGEEAVRVSLWASAHWRRHWLEGGRLEERV